MVLRNKRMSALSRIIQSPDEFRPFQTSAIVLADFPMYCSRFRRYIQVFTQMINIPTPIFSIK